LPIRPVIATPLAINQGIAKYYAQGLRDESAADEAIKGKARKAAAKSRARKARKRYKDLSPEEQYERTQLGYIIMCWGIVGSVLVDQFVLKGRFIPFGKTGSSIFNSFPFDQFLLSFFVPFFFVWWVYKVYWK
jgi:hypothetical protein